MYFYNAYSQLLILMEIVCVPGSYILYTLHAKVIHKL